MACRLETLALIRATKLEPRLKLGQCQPEVSLETAIIQTQLLEEVIIFTQLCASLEDIMHPDMVPYLGA